MAVKFIKITRRYTILQVTHNSIKMKKQLLFIFWLSLIGSSLQAQTTKPAVLVIGNGNAAAAAAIQAATSGVKTTLLLQAGGFDISPFAKDINSGIQANFITKIKAEKGIKDSLAFPAFDKTSANDVLKGWTDTLKNLTVIRNVSWIKAERSGKNWSFKLSDGKSIRPLVLINAGDQKLKAALQLKAIPISAAIPLDYAKTVYRTSIAAGPFLNNSTATVFSLYSFLIPEEENLIWLKEDEGMLIGQAAGATAAYAGFFGTKTSLSNLKIIQAELLNYKLALMPFADIALNNPNWKAIQMVGLMGILKAETKNNGAHFLALQPVNTEEVKQPIKDFYYKAQIWFDDYQSPTMTLESAIALICYVGNKSPQSTPIEIEKKWKSVYQFNTTFDLKRQINRQELAALLQDYMPPFNVNVDKSGKVIR